MGSFIGDIDIIDGPVPVVLALLAFLSIVALAIRPGNVRISRRRWTLIALGSGVSGAVVGLLLCWLIGDLADAFDVSLSASSRAWVAFAFAGIGVAIATLAVGRGGRRLAGAGAVILFVLVGAVGVNADFGQYTTIGSVVGTSSVPVLSNRALIGQEAAVRGHSPAVAPAAWVARGSLPSRGIVGSVTIPATASHFVARPAIVYLPPAALSADPPALPVLVMLSGQPGGPETVFLAGHLDDYLNAYAAAHRGLAPIVVVPDQLGAPDVNPMCIDSPIGNSATYLSVDVPNWIRSHLHVGNTARTWAIGGFSQGGTCAIQLGAADPGLFGSILDISGQVQPSVGSDATTIAAGFGGDAAAWQRAKPLTILAANAPYPNDLAVFVVGALDARYGRSTQIVSDAAAQAGIRTRVVQSPGTAHDWATVRYAFSRGLPTIFTRMGLTE